MNEINGASALDGFGDSIIKIALIATSSTNRIDLYTTAILNLDVIDVNNNAPRVYFNSREYQDDDIIRESYRENRRGQEVIEIEADDADSGSNGDIGWSLDPNDPDSIYFRLVPEAPSDFSTRSRLLVFFVQPPDYEQKTTYDIAIICFDKPLYPEQPNETRLRVSIRRVFKLSF